MSVFADMSAAQQINHQSTLKRMEKPVSSDWTSKRFSEKIESQPEIFSMNSDEGVASKNFDFSNVRELKVSDGKGGSLYITGKENIKVWLQENAGNKTFNVMEHQGAVFISEITTNLDGEFLFKSLMMNHSGSDHYGTLNLDGNNFSVTGSPIPLDLNTVEFSNGMALVTADGEILYGKEAENYIRKSGGSFSYGFQSNNDQEIYNGYEPGHGNVMAETFTFTENPKGLPGSNSNSILVNAGGSTPVKVQINGDIVIRPVLRFNFGSGQGHTLHQNVRHGAQPTIQPQDTDSNHKQ